MKITRLPFLSLFTLFLIPGHTLAAEEEARIYVRALSMENPAGDIHIGKEEDAIHLPTNIYRISNGVEVPADRPIRFYRKEQQKDGTDWRFIGEIDRNEQPGNRYTVLFSPPPSGEAGETGLHVLRDDHPKFASHQMRVLNLSGHELRTRDNGNMRLLPASEPVFFHFKMTQEDGDNRARPFLTFDRKNDGGEWSVFTRGPLLRHPDERLTLLIVHSHVLNAALQISDGDGEPLRQSSGLHIVSWRNSPPPLRRE